MSQNDLSKQLIKYIHDQLSSGKQLYAILDSARKPEIAWKPYEFFTEWVSLYKGEPEEILADVAPYLVNFLKKGQYNLELIKWIAEECWADSCAIFIESDYDLKNLLAHFQQFLMVMDEAGKAFYFRFYDPRVLRVYLPTCNNDELTTFFGPVQAFSMEGESAETINRFWISGKNLSSENITVI